MAFSIRNHRLASGGTDIRFVGSPNTGKALDPKFLVIHYTASGPDFDAAAYFSKRSAKVSAHLVIRRDGAVTQCAPFDKIAWHAGKSRWQNRAGHRFAGLNACSIGIELENWGLLRRAGAAWLSYAGSAVEGGTVTEARHRFGHPDGGWEIFPPAQVAACLAAARAICGRYGIEEILGHDDISPGRKSDPGPAWNMEAFRTQVFDRSEGGGSRFVVRSPSGLNLRRGPSAGSGLLRPAPLPDGTLVTVHEASGRWRYVIAVSGIGGPNFAGWVHGDFLGAV